jgi:hypothetical protein
VLKRLANAEETVLTMLE